MSVRKAAVLIGLGLVASAVGIALGLAIDWFPDQASTQAGPIDTLYDVLVIASVPIFVLVTGVVVYCVREFRETPETAGTDGPPIHGSTKLEVIWTVLPTILIAGLCAYAYVVLRDIEEEPAAASADQREIRVGVTGEQFAWTYTYPKEVTGDKALTTTRLVLPLGRSVDFRIRAKDVLHDFWVPEFRMKMDAVPGIETSYRVTPTRAGTFPVVCAELCGLGHSTMRSEVRVVSPERFAAFLREEAAPAVEQGASPTEQASAGKEIFTAQGCGGCHALADAGSSGGVGPDLDEVLEGQSVAQVTESIVEPDAKVEQGFARGVMPGSYGDQLSEQEIEALVTYLRRTAGS